MFKSNVNKMKSHLYCAKQFYLFTSYIIFFFNLQVSPSFSEVQLTKLCIKVTAWCSDVQMYTEMISIDQIS
jgi:hypothetical protein